MAFQEYSSLLKLNRGKLTKIFRMHAWKKINGVFRMTTEETTKMLKNLKLFPV